MFHEIIHVLLIEDNLAHATLLKRAFEAHEDPFDIAHFSSLASAIEYLESSTPQLALVDYKLPDGEGLSLLSEENNQSKFPIVIMTSQGDEELAVRALQSGAFNYIVKSPESFSQMPFIALKAIWSWQTANARKESRRLLKIEKDLLGERVQERTAELLRVNEELKRALQVKAEFLATVSHELKTPLSAILGTTQLLNFLSDPMTEKQRKLFQRIEASGHILLKKINDILDLTNLDANKLEIEVMGLSARDLCLKALTQTQMTAIERKISIQYPEQSLDFQVLVDPTRMEQILLQLLDNAVKFSLDNHRIGLDLSIDENQEWGHFEVWDQGPGIAKQHQQSIFEPFGQIDSRLSREHAGTGIGLVLVKKLTELQQGKVSLESQLGEGCRFRVSLPIFKDRTR